MSVLGDWLARRQRERARGEQPPWLDPARYSGPESYAVALAWYHVPADRARELLRAAIHRWERESLENWQATERRQRAADAHEARVTGATAAAERLLRDVGWREEEEPGGELMPPPRDNTSFMGPWLPPPDGIYQRATLLRDPLLDGPRDDQGRLT